MLRYLLDGIDDRVVEHRRGCVLKRFEPLLPPLYDSLLVPQQVAGRAPDVS